MLKMFFNSAPLSSHPKTLTCSLRDLQKGLLILNDMWSEDSVHMQRHVCSGSFPPVTNSISTP